MILGHYVIFQVEAGNKLKEIYLDPAALPVPGAPIVILRHNSLSFKQSNNGDSVGDLQQTIEVVTDGVQEWPMLKEHHYNGEVMIPQNFIALHQDLKPTSAVRFNITEWITENIRPISGELPDKGLMFEIDLQFWMNHYYVEKSGAKNVFHRTLTANKLLRFSMLALNYDDPQFVSGDLIELSFSGAFTAYESKPVLYQGVLDYGILDTTSFPASIELVNTGINLLIENNLRYQPNWQDVPDWNVSLLMRAQVKEFSLYDRTNEIIS